MRATNILSQKITFRHLLSIIGLTVLGALIAGTYGILHDQITYTISPEYFTKLKFEQFHYANFGLPDRVYVGEIGFLATWWVGLFSGGLLACVAVPLWPPAQATRYTLMGFAIIFGFAAAAGLVGFFLGYQRRSDPDFSFWDYYSAYNGVQDLPAFVNVAYIHNSSYLGGLIGLVVAVAFLIWKKCKQGI